MSAGFYPHRFPQYLTLANLKLQLFNQGVQMPLMRRGQQAFTALDRESEMQDVGHNVDN